MSASVGIDNRMRLENGQKTMEYEVQIHEVGPQLLTARGLDHARDLTPRLFALLDDVWTFRTDAFYPIK